MTQIAAGLNVYIKTSKLIIWDSLINKPRELARRLLKELISEEELKTMTAVGRIDKKEVPEEIREAIFCKTKLFVKFFITYLVLS